MISRPEQCRRRRRGSQVAHPEVLTVEQRAKRQHLSPLMQRKAAAQKNEVVNACPFGCGVQQLDENGYCKHLVGFTNDQKSYEPMVRKGGRRVVQCRMEPTGEVHPDEGEPLLAPKLERVRDTDKLVQITTSYRVYRDVDGAGERIERERAEEEARKRAEQRRLLLEDLKNDPGLRGQLLEQLTAVG